MVSHHLKCGSLRLQLHTSWCLTACIHAVPFFVQHGMPFPTKVCVVCEEEFELRPDHPGYANKCRDCNAPQEDRSASTAGASFEGKREADAERRRAIKDMLYPGK